MSLRDRLRGLAADLGLLDYWRAWRWQRQAAASRRRQAERYPDIDRSSMPLIFGNAMSKSGSQMLAQMLEALEEHTPLAFTDRHPVRTLDDRGQARPPSRIRRQLARLEPGDVAWGYLPSTAAVLDWYHSSDCAMFFLYRDPRDRIVSHILYAMNIHKGHAMRDYYHQLPSMQARIAQTIVGVPGLVEPVHEAYASYQGWFEADGVLPVRFEDLIRSRQSTLERMLAHLVDHGVPLQHETGAIIASLNRAMSPEQSPTFRKGEPGDWRKHFDAENIRLFNRIAGDLLDRLGYQEQAAAQEGMPPAQNRRMP